jgi:superfamily II DNA or RNA helicase
VVKKKLMSTASRAMALAVAPRATKTGALQPPPPPPPPLTDPNANNRRAVTVKARHPSMPSPKIVPTGSATTTATTTKRKHHDTVVMDTESVHKKTRPPTQLVSHKPVAANDRGLKDANDHGFEDANDVPPPNAVCFPSRRNSVAAPVATSSSPSSLSLATVTSDIVQSRSGKANVATERASANAAKVATTSIVKPLSVSSTDSALVSRIAVGTPSGNPFAKTNGTPSGNLFAKTNGTVVAKHVTISRISTSPSTVASVTNGVSRKIATANDIRTKSQNAKPAIGSSINIKPSFLHGLSSADTTTIDKQNINVVNVRSSGTIATAAAAANMNVFSATAGNTNVVSDPVQSRSPATRARHVVPLAPRPVDSPKLSTTTVIPVLVPIINKPRPPATPVKHVSPKKKPVAKVLPPNNGVDRNGVRANENHVNGSSISSSSGDDRRLPKLDVDQGRKKAITSTAAAKTPVGIRAAFDRGVVPGDEKRTQTSTRVAAPRIHTVSQTPKRKASSLTQPKGDDDSKHAMHETKSVASSQVSLSQRAALPNTPMPKTATSKVVTKALDANYNADVDGNVNGDEGDDENDGNDNDDDDQDDDGDQDIAMDAARKKRVGERVSKRARPLTEDEKKQARADERRERLKMEAAKKTLREEKRAHAAAVWETLTSEEREARANLLEERRAKARRRRESKNAVLREERAAEEERYAALRGARNARIAAQVETKTRYMYGAYAIDARLVTPAEYAFHKRHLTIVPRESRPRRMADGSVDRRAQMRDANQRKKKTIPLWGEHQAAPDAPFVLRVPPQYGLHVFGALPPGDDLRPHGKLLPAHLRLNQRLWGPEGGDPAKPDPFDQQHVARLLEEHVALFKRGGILELPTSCGKTLIMIWIIVVLLKRKALIVLPMLAIHTQLMMRLEAFVPGIRVGSIQGQTYDVKDKDVVVAMVHTLANSPQLMARPDFEEFGIVLFDEVDRIATSAFSRVLTGVAFIRYMFGLSATVERPDGMDRMFELYLGDMIYSAPRSTKQNRLTTIVRLHYDDGDQTTLFREPKSKTKPTIKPAIVTAAAAAKSNAKQKAKPRVRLKSGRAGGGGGGSSSSSGGGGGGGDGDQADGEEEMIHPRRGSRRQDNVEGDGDEGLDLDYVNYDCDDEAEANSGGGNSGSGSGKGGGGGRGGGGGDMENADMDIQAMNVRLTTDEKRHAYVMRLLLLLLERGRRIAVLVTDIAYAKRILKECQEAFPAKMMVHYAATLKTIERQDIDEVAHDLIVASFGIFSVGIDLAYLDTLVFAMPRRTITQAAGRLRAIARGWDRLPLFIYDVIDTFGMYRSQAAARLKVYREKMFSLLKPVSAADYVADPQFPPIEPLTPEQEAVFEQDSLQQAETRRLEAQRQRNIFDAKVAALPKVKAPPLRVALRTPRVQKGVQARSRPSARPLPPLPLRPHLPPENTFVLPENTFVLPENTFVLPASRVQRTVRT